MTLIHKLCTLLRHPFRRLMRCDVQSDSPRTRWYSCRVCGEVFPVEEDEDG